jgi:hypothetical protein
MTERILVDTWTVEVPGGPQSTEVYSDGRVALIIKEILRDGRGQVTRMPFAHGEELQRLIAALQPGKRA